MLQYLTLLTVVTSSFSYCIWANVSQPDKALLNCEDVLRRYRAERRTLLNTGAGAGALPKQNVKIGLLFPKQKADCAPLMEPVQGIAAQLAISDINANRTLLPDYELELVTIPAYDKCSRAFDTLGYAYVLKYNYSVSVIIGPACGDRSSGQSVATFAKSENLPVISVASFSDELNDVKKYPTITRLQESTVIQAYYHAGIYDYFKWKTVVIIKERNNKPICTEKYDKIAQALRDMPDRDYLVKEYEVDSNGDISTEGNINAVISTYRVISILANPLLARLLVLRFYRTCKEDSGCVWSDYRLIVMNFQIGSIVNNTRITPWLCDQSVRTRMRPMRTCGCCTEKEREDDEEGKRAYTSVIQLVNDLPPFSEQREYQCRVMEELKPIMGTIKPPIGCIEDVFLWQQTYDSILLYAHALNVTNDIDDGKGLTDVIKTLDNVEGQTGRIVTNPIGSRYMDVLAYFLLDERDQEMTNVLKLLPDRSSGVFKAILAPGQNTPKSVPDHPPCKWSDLTCSNQLKDTLICSGVAIILCIVVYTVVRIWFYVKYGPDNVFIVSEEDLKKLQLSKGKRVTLTDTDLRVSLKDTLTIQTLRELRNIHHNNIVNSLHCSLEPGNLIVVTETCSKGLLHDLILSEEKVGTSAFVKSFALDIVKGLSYLHASVFEYHGSLTSLNCLVDARWNIKLTGFYQKDLVKHYYQSEYYKNTSCNDYVEMETWDDDVIGKGLYGSLWMSPEYLKNKISNNEGYRANDIFSFGVILFQLLYGTGPYNIVMEQERDNIGVVISDQISKIKNGITPSAMMLSDHMNRSHEDSLHIYDDAEELYEKAERTYTPNEDAERTSTSNEDAERTSTPNIVEGLCENGQRTSTPNIRITEADCTEEDLVMANYDDIISYTSDCTDTVSVLPHHSVSTTFDTDLYTIKRICIDCTNPDPANRPDIQSLIATLEQGSQAFLGTVLDQWLITLEARSADLKRQFDLKNEDMRREKEKTKKLVYSLLPREIAEQKMSGQTVTPQFFSNCSFFFSDIKGFTKIVADLPGGPMDVVSMLDELYCIMDAAIEKYKVVKVETIGDAYVVVSGLPIPHINGTLHAKEIAAFALEVIATTSDIKVKQLDNRPVYMRIGIHSGGCVAGVVGNTMYHYCIYGNEPRYANSLESSGEASRVHMSNDMRRILDHSFHNVFTFVERKPAVSISGFKKKPTYWLTGEVGVERDLPNDHIYQNTGSKRNMSNASITTATLRGIAKFKADTLGYSSGRRIRTISDSLSKSSNSKANTDPLSKSCKVSSESEIGKFEKRNVSQK